jgi:hypothetical protein
VDAGKKVPFWIVQEIGTATSAKIKRAAAPPAPSPSHVRTVKAQHGRIIHRGLAFGTGPTGKWTQPGAAVGQNLHSIRNLEGVPPWGIGRVPRIVIQREIHGKRMVAQGGEAGFRQYYEEVLAAARQAFGGFARG